MKRSQQPAGNLPAQLTSFVGRRATLAQIIQLLAKNRLVTLTGTGGVGKSRAALEVAHRVARAWCDGTWLIELAGLGAPELLPNVVAAVLGVREQAGSPLIETLAGYLESRRMLLVLDNCEHLSQESAMFCNAMLRGCPQLRILCTSRQPLRISGEAVVALTPLQTPAGDEPASQAALMQFEAVRLFVERAGAAAPDFVLTAQNCKAVVALTRKLDGIPLGLELAAVLVRTLALGDLVERLDDSFSLLNLGSAAALPRHQTLRMAIDWSHDLLSEDERMLWRRLAVFSGGFTLEAAETVCGDARLPANRVAPTLTSLVEKSLVAGSLRGEHGRYAMLEILRQYARERLREAREEGPFVKAHYEWCAGLVNRPDGAWWTGRRQIEWLSLMKAEQANLRAALDACLEDPPRTEAGLSLAVRLFLHWIVQNTQSEACHYIEALLARTTVSSASQAGALFARGFIAPRGEGDLARARSSFEEARRIGAAFGYERELGWSLAGLAMTDLIDVASIERPKERAARFSRLRADLGRAIELLSATGDDVIHAWALCLLGDVYAQLGDGERARSYIEDSVALSESAGDVWVQANARLRLGIQAWQSGHLDRARETLRHAICAQREIGHHWGLAMSLEALACVCASAAQQEHAARLLGAADRLWKQTGIKPHVFINAHHDRCAAEAKKSLGEARYINAYRRGENMVLDEVLAHALGEPQSTALVKPPKSRAPALSRREMDVARLIADGATNRQIAAGLIVSERTVKTHIEHIMNKLGVESRAQIAVWVTQRSNEEPLEFF